MLTVKAEWSIVRLDGRNFEIMLPFNAEKKGRKWIRTRDNN